MGIDSVTLAVVSGWLQQITDEMDEALCCSAFSPTISEGYDRASGIYLANGDLVAQGVTSMPCFVETMQAAVKFVIEEVSKEGEEFSPGDIYMMNDPYSGGSHLPDVKFFKPFYYQGKLLFWLANTGHWPDIGGAAPGGFMGGTTDIMQEGIRIPPIKIYEKGKLNREIIKLLSNNVRTPEERMGDLKAQVGTLRIGEERLINLLEKYGEDTVMACVEEMEKRTEKHLRSCIKEIPDGIYSATGFLDNDGVIDVPIRLSVDIEVRGDNICFDFSKSDPPSRGQMNASKSLTISACYIALRHIFPDIPVNSGILKPVKIVVPENSFLNAKFPRPVVGMAMIMDTITTTCFSAFAQAIPQLSVAESVSTNNNTVIAGIDSERGSYLMYMFTGGGYGGYEGGDGLTYGVIPCGICKVQPYEVFEQHYPVIVREFSLREGSAGLGKYRGGFGANIVIEFLGEEASFGCVGDDSRFPPRGILGGTDAAVNEEYIIRSDGKRENFPMGAKGQTVLKKGDRFVIKTPGGGGYGDPHERPRHLILSDILNGYYERQTAEKVFNVSICDDELEAAKLTV